MNGNIGDSLKEMRARTPDTGRGIYGQTAWGRPMGCKVKDMSKESAQKKSVQYAEICEPRDFTVGDLAVYPAHGVGRIEAVESRSIGGDKQNFYIMRILENNMVIMIPTRNVSSVGLRELIAENDVQNIYNILGEKDNGQDNQTWNRRYRDYMEKIKTGSLYEVAGVFRDLYLLKSTKDLSFGERKLLDTAQTLLLKELSIAKSTSEEVILSEIESLLVN